MELIFENYVKKYPEILKTINIFEGDFTCAFSGAKVKKVVKTDEVFKDNFVVLDAFRHMESGHIDYRIAILLANYNNHSGLRNHCIIAYEDEMEIISYSTFAEKVFAIKKVPFEVVFSFTLKKHIAYKATQQFDIDNFIIYTDRGEAIFKRSEINEWYPIVKRWYSEYKKEKSYFTQSQIAGKTEIAPSQIMNYGKKRFFEEDKILDKYRNTLIFELLIFKTLKKDEYSN